MKTLIVEDDFTSRLLLQELLKGYGPSHIAVNGKEAVEAVRLAFEAGDPYRLICLDIMMPIMDGQLALAEIRKLEQARGLNSSQGAKIVMTTALSDVQNVGIAYKSLCDAYLTKPIQKAKLLEELRGLGLMDDEGLARLMSEVFLADMPKQLAALRRCLEAGDLRGAQRQARIIKGASANVGGECLRQLANEMEELGLAGNLDAITTRMAELETQFTLFKDAMTKEWSTS